MASAADVNEYKEQLRALFDPEQRAELQAILQTFIQERSFERLAEALPFVLDTAPKRTIGPTLMKLIPPRFQPQFAAVLAGLPPPGTFLGNTTVQDVLMKHRGTLRYENVAPVSYENWADTPKPSRRPWLPESYMCGNLSRVEAEAMLKSKGFTEGLFLVREKPNPALAVSYVLSMVHKGVTLHLLLEARPGASITLNGDLFGACNNIPDFITLMRRLNDEFEYRLRRPLLMDMED